MILTYYHVDALLLALSVLIAFAMINKFCPGFSPELLFNGWNRPRVGTLLGVLILAICTFAVYFGNNQFGGYDQSIIVDTQWRYFQGQKPFVDFYCTLPPGFLLGLKYSNYFRFAPWDSQLALNAAFAAITFLWFYFLLKRLLFARAVALLVALCMEACSTLFACHWWYNTISSVSGGLFFLSVLCFVYAPRGRFSQCSLVFSLALLGIMKPNISVPLIVGSVAIIGATGWNIVRFVILMFVSFSLDVIVLLTNSIPPLIVLRNFREISRSRGLLTPQGFLDYTATEFVFAMALLALLVSPVVVSLYFNLTRPLSLDRKSLCSLLLLLLGPTVAVIGMLTNGEYKYVDMVLIVLTGSLLIFSDRTSFLPVASRSNLWPKFYGMVLCVVCVLCLYSGAVRRRVKKIGPFYEVPANQIAGSPVFPHLRVGPQLIGTLRDVSTELRSIGDKKNVFFGPRMEFCYAMFGLRSPRSLPIWLHPGTSFPAWREGEVINKWRKSHFSTLVFLKGDYTYYPPALLRTIKNDYICDQTYPYLTVFRAKRPFVDD